MNFSSTLSDQTPMNTDENHSTANDVISKPTAQQEVYVAAARSTQNFIGIFIGVHREAFQTGILPREPPLNTDELSINE